MLLQFDSLEKTYAEYEDYAAKQLKKLRNNNRIAFTPTLVQNIMPHLNIAKFCCQAELLHYDKRIFYMLNPQALKSVLIRSLSFFDNNDARLCIMDCGDICCYWHNIEEKGITLLTETKVPACVSDRNINLSKS